MYATWGTTLFSGQESIFKRVCREWVDTGPSFEGPGAGASTSLEAKIETEFLAGKYTIWTTAASASAALILVLDMIKSEAMTGHEAAVLYGAFSYVGFSGSNVAHSTCPVFNGESPHVPRGAVPSVLPLPYYLEVAHDQRVRDDAALKMFRHLCTAWALRERRIVAVVVEPMISWTGHRLSPYFLRELQSVATKLKVCLVLDEVLTAFRLAGSLYCFELGFTPDVVILGKVFGFGMALLKSDLCKGTAGPTFRRATTGMPLCHLQYMHEMLQVWTRKFDKRAIMRRRKEVVEQLCRQLGIDGRDIYGEGLMICGPFFVNVDEMRQLNGPKNRMLVIVDGQTPRNMSKHICVDQSWKKNMDAMAAQLNQMFVETEANVYYRAALFLETSHVSGTTENELWDAAAKNLKMSRKEVKQLFQRLMLVTSSRKADSINSKSRVRSFTFSLQELLSGREQSGVQNFFGHGTYF
jgi:hypothetical protein